MTSRRGFTLIEIMLAMAIFVMGAVGLIALFTKAMDLHARAVDMEIASLIASSVAAKCEVAFDAEAIPLDAINVPVETYANYFYDVSWTPMVPVLQQPTVDGKTVVVAASDRLTAEEIEEAAKKHSETARVNITVRWKVSGSVREEVYGIVLHRVWRDKKKVRFSS